KITTFRGKRGTWVTTKTGRRIFIEEDRIKTYLMWTNAAKAQRAVDLLGVGALVTGVVGGGLLAGRCSRILKKCGYSALSKGLSVLGAVVAAAGVGTFMAVSAKREEYARERLRE
ncbi:hypothetical protein DRO59_06890, partial [Candidatus Bathyarchaeota archaeon]